MHNTKPVSQLASKPQREAVISVYNCLVPSALCGPSSQPQSGLRLGYVGLRLDPPGLTDFWGVDVVPTW